MKRLRFIFGILALASCQGGKEAVNQALPVIDMNEDYPEKEIVLQDIADISIFLWRLTTNFCSTVR